MILNNGHETPTFTEERNRISRRHQKRNIKKNACEMNAIPMENIEQLENLDNSDIAVIGLACRFPDAKRCQFFLEKI